MSSVGERIKKLRKEKKLTLAQVAQDKMSSAMVSLIENGKSKPSAENLEHIANVLDVSITDLLGGVSRGDLRLIAEDITKRLEEKLDLETLNTAILELRELFPKLGHNLESARIYELYVHCIYSMFVFYPDAYKQIPDNEWEMFYEKAENIYADFQMESKVLRIRRKLVQIESTKGNYQRTIDLIDNSLELVSSMDSLDIIFNVIRLKLLKVYTLAALGNMDEALHLLQDVISFSNEHLMLSDFFEIYNLAAMYYYQENEHEKAREYVKKINSFFEIINNENLYIEKELIMVHYMEFFEDRPDLALDMILKLEKRIPEVNLYNDVIDRRMNKVVSDMKARCYTKLNKPEEALPLFRNQLEDFHTGLHPVDIALREVNKSYKALCYIQLNDKGNALKYAKEGVSVLKKYPHTAYYHFALNVLRDAQQMK